MTLPWKGRRREALPDAKVRDQLPEIFLADRDIHKRLAANLLLPIATGHDMNRKGLKSPGLLSLSREIWILLLIFSTITIE